MKVFVKWGTQKYEVELNLERPVVEFREVLLGLTGVPTHRQRLLLKGQQIKDANDWASVKYVTEGVTMMLLGSAAEIPMPPSERPLFIEDIPDDEVNTKLEIPPGLVNLGNTCFANATLQMLFKIRGIRDHLIAKVAAYTAADNEKNLCFALGNLFSEMKAAVAVNPLIFVTFLRLLVSDFAEQDSQGNYLQHDAEEFLNRLFQVLSKAMPECPISESLEIEYETTWTAKDDQLNMSNEVTRSRDLKITCHLADSQATSLPTCISSSMRQTVQRRSETDNIERTYESVSKISRAPPYLCVHLARFYWRADIKKRVKIRRNVVFQMDLDIKHCCKDDIAMETRYTLCSVVTHIGASSDGGHYVAFVRHDKNEQWFVADDDKVKMVDATDVLRTSGQSADSHIAYILLYVRNDILIENSNASSSSTTQEQA